MKGHIQKLKRYIIITSRGINGWLGGCIDPDRKMRNTYLLFYSK
jgi:hypothetical protein